MRRHLEMLRVGGRTTVELTDTGRRYQYRRTDTGYERRILGDDGAPLRDGSPWEQVTEAEIADWQAHRGQWHPILDALEGENKQ